MDVSHLVTLTKKYCIPYDIKLLAPSPDERAYYSRLGCVAISELPLKTELQLSLHSFFRAILGLYRLAPA